MANITPIDRADKKDRDIIQKKSDAVIELLKEALRVAEEARDNDAPITTCHLTFIDCYGSSFEDAVVEKEFIHVLMGSLEMRKHDLYMTYHDIF